MSSHKKKPFDLVEKPFNPELIGEWIGYKNIDHIFYLTYIKKNFQKQLHFLPFVHPVLFDYIFGKYNYMTIYDDNKKKDFTRDNISEYKKYLSLYKNTKKRFTYFPITIMEIAEYKDNPREVVGHAISAIHDKKTQEVEIFDSNPLNIKKLGSEISKFFEDIYGKDIKVIYIHKCFSLSRLEIDSCYDTPYKYASEGGFCVIWTLWYLELRLKNRELSRDQTIDKAIGLLKHGPKNTKVCELLRGYAQFVDKTVDKYIVVNKNGRNTLAPNPDPRVFANSVPTTNFNIKPESIKNNKDYLIALGLLSAIIGVGAAIRALKKHYNKNKK
jgi:hypothetical protein